MKKQIISTLTLVIAFILLSFDLPKGWFRSGSAPAMYNMGVDKDQPNHKSAATIKSIKKKIPGFGTLMQECIPGKYLGKRVKMTGYMKTAHVKRWAGFWFRVDQKGSKESLSFDNMHDRRVKGTTDWTKYELVLDVPENASMLAYGALIAGPGQIWFDDINFEIVENSIATTGH